MTHTVHPYAHRLGIIRDWKSRWFGVNEKYRESLKGDITIRMFLEKRLKGYYVNSIEIERTEKEVKVIIETSRPGVIIGRNGEGATKLKNDLIKLLKSKNLLGKEEFKLDIKELHSPESSAAVVAQMIAEGLAKRLPFRRVLKQTVEKVLANRDVKGVKVELSGRLGGADMAQNEKLRKGQVPLQTFRSDVDYVHHLAVLPYGSIGIKVWINKGEVFEKSK